MKYLIVLILALVSPLAFGAKSDVDRLQTELLGLQNFSSTFTQTIFSSRFGDQKAKGEVVIAKPNKMRWIYEMADEAGGNLVSKEEAASFRIFLADGTTFYRYDSSDKVPLKTDQKEMMKDPSSFFFLWKNITLQDHFTIAEKSLGQGKVLFHLQPKDKQSEMKQITLTVSFAPFTIETIETINQMGQKNRLVFHESSINNKFATSTFDYDVVKATLEKKP